MNKILNEYIQEFILLESNLYGWENATSDNLKLNQQTMHVDYFGDKQWVPKQIKKWFKQMKLIKN